MNNILLDSDVIINLLKKQDKTITKMYDLIDTGCKFFITPVSVAEIYAGAFKREIPQIETLFSHFESLKITHEIGVISGQYANQYRKAYQGISLEDYMIAGSAKHYHLTLWTYNKKHYPMEGIHII